MSVNVALRIAIVGVVAGVSLSSMGLAGETGIPPTVTTAVRFDVSPPLFSLAPLSPSVAAQRGAAIVAHPRGADSIVQKAPPTSALSAPLLSFNGLSNLAHVAPPSPSGDVGHDHYVLMSNLYFRIFDKAGNSLYGPAANNTLWSGFGGACETENAGDPIVLYDQFARRWLLTQFTVAGPTYYNCVALSTGPDPTGTYYRWAFSTGSNLPDYPKYGVWNNAYYVSTREFTNGSIFAGVGVYALNRAQMIAGNPTPTVISFLVAPGGRPLYQFGDGLLPADIDGSVPPPADSPEYFVGIMDDGGPYAAPQDAITLWRFVADFGSPISSSFSLAATLPVFSFDSIFPCSPGARSCIPQPGTVNKLDVLSYRQWVMHRLAYRNFGDHEALVTNRAVEVAAGVAGIRWFELRDPKGSPILFQEGTISSGAVDGVSRWMGSVAMDGAGNIAVGYSASSATTFPSVWYTGRLAGDPLGSMPQGEHSIVDGTGSETGTQRWGDYTSMNIDPVDDCTFWYANEWVPVSGSFAWVVRVGAFEFNPCEVVAVFADGFESGDTVAWSASVP